MHLTTSLRAPFSDFKLKKDKFEIAAHSAKSKSPKLSYKLSTSKAQNRQFLVILAEIAANSKTQISLKFGD